MYNKERELVEIGSHSYNLKSGGEGGFDYINTSNIAKFRGKNHSKETIEIIRERAHSRVHTLETKIKISKNNGMRNKNVIDRAVQKRLGIPLSEERKKKISDSVKLYYRSKAELVY